MYLLRPYLLLLSVCALPGNASPASPPILPNRPSNISDAGNTLNSTSPLGANGWPFTDRPVGLDYHINDYNIRAQVTRPTIPDSGDGDPQKISKALKVISVWIPTQENPDGSFPRSLRYEGVTDGVKYTFIAGEVRWDLNTEMLQLAVEGCRRYAVVSKSAKLPTISWLAFVTGSLAALGELSWGKVKSTA